MTTFTTDRFNDPKTGRTLFGIYEDPVMDDHTKAWHFGSNRAFLRKLEKLSSRAQLGPDWTRPTAGDFQRRRLGLTLARAYRVRV